MNQTEYKIRNLESQILYLQEEHSKTLKLLHAEIKDLQMKNSESNFQLAMINVSSKDSNDNRNPDQSDNICDENLQLKSKIEFLNLQLTHKVADLQSYENKIENLTGTITKLKEFHKSEIETLEIELLRKSTDIAHLSTKLLSLSRNEQPNSASLLSDEFETVHIKTPLIPQAPNSLKIFKYRNQVSIHPDNILNRRRPIVSRQTAISTALPIKNRLSSPLLRDYAISVEDKSSFSKSIKRPHILPPINPSRNHNLNNEKHTFPISTQNSVIDPYLIEAYAQYRDSHASENKNLINNIDANTNFSLSSSDPNNIHIEVDRILDNNNNSMVSPSI